MLENNLEAFNRSVWELAHIVICRLYTDLCDKNGLCARMCCIIARDEMKNNCHYHHHQYAAIFKYNQATITKKTMDFSIKMVNCTQRQPHYCVRRATCVYAIYYSIIGYFITHLFPTLTTTVCTHEIMFMSSHRMKTRETRSFLPLCPLQMRIEPWLMSKHNFHWIGRYSINDMAQDVRDFDST